jgi:GAF domain-containing protein
MSAYRPDTGMSEVTDLRVVCVDPDPEGRADTAAAIDADADMVADPVETMAAALDRLATGEVDCLVAEHDLADGIALDLFERARERDPGLACVLFTDAAVADLGRDSFTDVVAEYLPKDAPDAHDRLRHLVRTVVTNRFHVGYPVPADEDDRLAAVRAYDVPDISAVESFDRLTRLIANHYDIAMAFVGLIDERDEEFLACHGADWGTLAREDSVCTYAILEDDVTVVEHVQDDPRFEANETLRELGVRSYAGANLTTPDGHTVGQVCLIHDEPRAYTETELADLQLFADEVMEQLELRRRLADATASRAGE